MVVVEDVYCTSLVLPSFSFITACGGWAGHYSDDDQHDVMKMLIMSVVLNVRDDVKVIVSANRVYQDFLGSEDGSGFSGQVVQ